MRGHRNPEDLAEELGPMYGSRYATRISIAVVGEVETGVDTHSNTGQEQGSWLSVRTGPVLSYCQRPVDVLGRAAAWNDARAKATRILPAESDEQPIERDRVIAQVTAQHHDTWDITGYTAAAARDGVPALYVRTGAITFRCYDQLAVVSIQEIWRDAAIVCRLLWRPRLVREP